VVDASHPDWSAQVEAVREVLDELNAGDKPVVHAMNKADAVPHTEVRRIIEEIGEGVAISALQKVGLINLLRRIGQKLPQPLVKVRLLVPYAKARALSQIFSQGRVLRQDYGAEGIAVEAELPRVQAQQLRALVRKAN